MGNWTPRKLKSLKSAIQNQHGENLLRYIYIWCRPFDEAEERILKESEALMEILRMADRKQVEILGSSALLAEVSFISSEEKREAVKALIRKSCTILKVEKDVAKFAEEIMKDCKIDAMDAVHIALASLNADIFITVDDELLKKAKCLEKYIDVRNPVDIV